MKRALNVFLAAIVVLVCTHAASAGPSWTLLEELSVPSQGGTVTSSVTLLSGVTYRLEASGTFLAGDSLEADAEYSHKLPDGAWQDDVPGYTQYGEGLLELKVNGNFVEWGDFDPSHVYTIDLVGTGDPVEFNFEIYDIYSQNNQGKLTAKIYAPVPAPGAILLGSLGAGLVGYWRRRNAF